MLYWFRINFLLLLSVVLSLIVSGFAYSSEMRRMYYKKNSYDLYRVAPARKNIHFYWKDRRGNRYFSFKRLKSNLRKRGRKLIFATNAGIFEWGYSPLGLYIEKGRRIESLNRRSGTGNFYVKPNGVFYIAKNRAGILSTRKFAKSGIRARYATQSGPMLVRHNIIHRRFSRKSKSRKIRNGVGIDRRGRMVFVISRTPVNMYQFAEFFRNRMRCANALYLDGHISKMYLPGIKRNELQGNFAVIIAASERIKKQRRRKNKKR